MTSSKLKLFTIPRNIREAIPTKISPTWLPKKKNDTMRHVNMEREKSHGPQL